MKNEKTLQEKIAEIEEKMPGLSEALKKHEYSLDNGSQQIEDIEYDSTMGYNVVAVKTERHYWTQESGIGWVESVDLFVSKKDDSNTIYTEYGFDRTTRDAFNQDNDRKDLWSYDYAFLKPANYMQNIVTCAWADEDGNKVNEETFCLDCIAKEK